MRVYLLFGYTLKGREKSFACVDKRRYVKHGVSLMFFKCEPRKSNALYYTKVGRLKSRAISRYMHGIIQFAIQSSDLLFYNLAV